MATQSRTPIHLWIVGMLALLWNGFGAFDYTMTRMKNVEYLSSMGDPKVILAYIDSFPIWAQFGWGLGVWSGVVGAVLLLVRSRYAVHAFAASLIGMALSFGYQFAGPPAPPEMAEMTKGVMAFMPILIVFVGISLLLYARAMKAKGALR